MESALVVAIQTGVSSIAGAIAGVAKARGHAARIAAVERGLLEIRRAVAKIAEEDHVTLPPSSISVSSPPAVDGSADLRRDLADLKSRLDKLEAACERENREFSAFHTALSRELGQIGGKIEMLLSKGRT